MYYILSQTQYYGFRKAKSTEDAMANLITRVYDALGKGEPAICAFVNLAKAFYTVSHRKRLQTL